MNTTVAVGKKPTTYSYPMTTPGPYLCWRGDVTNTTKYPAAWFDTGAAYNFYNNACSDIGTQYYVNPTLSTNDGSAKVYNA